MNDSKDTLQGADELINKCNNLEVNINKELLKIVDRNVRGTVQAEAKILAPIGPGGGELRGSIRVKTELKDDTIISHCYTNSDHAAYVEFGTGPNGQENHEGISPNVKVVYTQRGWMIPADAMSESDAERYGLKIARRGNETIGYYTKGSYAHPFLYPALKNNEKKVSKDINNEAREFIRKVASK